MECKYCFAQMEEDATVCPVCGKEQVEIEEQIEEQKDAALVVAKKRGARIWKGVAAVVSVLLVACILTGAILYSMGLADQVAFKFKGIFHSLNFWRDNDLNYRLDYSVSDSKAESKQDVVVATVGSQKLTNGQLQVFYWRGVTEFVNNYYYYLTDMGLDITRPLSEQIADEATGQTFQQVFLSDAIENWRTYAVLAEAAVKAGHQLTQEQKDYLATYEQEMATWAAEDGYKNAEEMIDDTYPGSSVAAYYDYNYISLLALSYYDVLYEDLMPTMEQMEAYYTENEAALTKKGYTKENGNYYDVRHILIGISAADANAKEYTEADWANCKAKAQTILDAFLESDQAEEKFAELANMYSADTGSNTNGGLYEKLTKGTSFTENFKNWYLDPSRQVGDTGLVQTEYGYHIMYFAYTTPIWEYEVKKEMLETNTTKMMGQLVLEYPMEVDYTKIVLGQADLLG